MARIRHRKKPGSTSKSGGSVFNPKRRKFDDWVYQPGILDRLRIAERHHDRLKDDIQKTKILDDAIECVNAEANRIENETNIFVESRKKRSELLTIESQKQTDAMRQVLINLKGDADQAKQERRSVSGHPIEKVIKETEIVMDKALEAYLDMPDQLQSTNRVFNLAIFHLETKQNARVIRKFRRSTRWKALSRFVSRFFVAVVAVGVIFGSSISTGLGWLLSDYWYLPWLGLLIWNIFKEYWYGPWYRRRRERTHRKHLLAFANQLFIAEFGLTRAIGETKLADIREDLKRKEYVKRFNFESMVNDSTNQK